MKKSGLKKMQHLKSLLNGQLFASFKRALGMIARDSESTSTLQVMMRESPGTFLVYDELRKTNDNLLRIERLKAEGIRWVQEHNRCI